MRAPKGFAPRLVASPAVSDPSYFDWVRQEAETRKRLKPWTLIGTGDVLWVAVRRTPYWRKRTAMLNEQRRLEVERATAEARRRLDELKAKLEAGVPLADGSS